MSGTGRVLVVDDEDAIRDLVEFTLTRLGYEVSQAATALQGIELYQEKLRAGKRFDLVILDLTLPGGMGGKEALKKLIEVDPTVNAIVSSGYATDATMSRYEDFGFRDRKSTRLNSSHTVISYAVFCLKKKKQNELDFYPLQPAGIGPDIPPTNTRN